MIVFVDHSMTANLVVVRYVSMVTIDRGDVSNRIYYPLAMMLIDVEQDYHNRFS